MGNLYCSISSLSFISCVQFVGNCRSREPNTLMCFVAIYVPSDSTRPLLQCEWRTQGRWDREQCLGPAGLYANDKNQGLPCSCLPNMTVVVSIRPFIINIAITTIIILLFLEGPVKTVHLLQTNSRSSFTCDHEPRHQQQSLAQYAVFMWSRIPQQSLLIGQCVPADHSINQAQRSKSQITAKVFRRQDDSRA
jgi:hypothetical protein